jgi:elongation factor P--(R)-beta-lysine ligase
VLEVETPALSQAANPSPALDSMAVVIGREVRYLHTSPEFAMKRLLAAGSGAIYQIARVWRQGESGRRHNPEFTLLEWYRPGWSYHELMQEVAELVSTIIGEIPISLVSYRQLFLQHLGLDPLDCDTDRLALIARQHGWEIAGSGQLDRDGWLDLLLSHAIEPHLGQGELTFVTDYPASQAALARLSPADPRLAERFELYLHGIELANGFAELTAAEEQRQRFHAELAARSAAGLPQLPIDEALLAALEAGLPATSGVALGLDRLLMLASDTATIAEVMAFAWDRA